VSAVTTRSRWRRRACVLGVAAVVVASLSGGEALAAPPQQACENRTNNTYDNVLECVGLEGVRAHQGAFQAIADANGGTRAAGTPGYTASVEYVVDRLKAAGWNVTLDEFDFLFFPPPILQKLTPMNASYETGAFTGTGTGDVTGNVIPVDINLAPPRQHQRLRGRRLRRPGLQRPERHRAHPARHVHIRREGAQRAGGQRRGGDHLQSGERPDP
jgi:hypothetical protein